MNNVCMSFTDINEAIKYSKANMGVTCFVINKYSDRTWTYSTNKMILDGEIILTRESKKRRGLNEQ